MPDTSELKPIAVICAGGLFLDKSPQDIPDGGATVLQNFEADLGGGYRRMDGFTEYSSAALSGSGQVLGIAILGSQVIGCRGDNVEYGTGTTWTNAGTRTSAGKYVFDKYDWTGTERIIMVDGVNHAATWDGSTYDLLDGAIGAGAGTAPTAPTCVAEFKGHIFLGQGHLVTFSAPFDADDYTTGSGAGQFKVPDGTVRAMKKFRDELYILCSNSIYKITGNDLSDFALVPVSKDIGVRLDAHSVQEIGGDIVFLAPDGLRTIKGTAKIGDVELGTISKPIQIVTNAISDTATLTSCVVRKKSQYRLWYPNTNTGETSSRGVIGVLKRTASDTSGSTFGWEWSEMVGIRPSYSVSDYITNTETVLHGGWSDGKIYKQESGNSFNGTTIQSVYRSKDFHGGDVGIQKTVNRVITNVRYEGSVDIDLYMIYDFAASTTPQPDKFSFSTDSSLSVYGTGIYGTSVYGSNTTFLNRVAVEGSGFTTAVRFEDLQNASPSFSVRGFQIEFVPGGRR